MKPRKPFITALIMGEGETEGAFLCHLKSLYCYRGQGIQVKVDWAYGGSPVDIITEAVKLKHGADYSRSALLLDKDVVWTDEALQLAKQHNLILIGSSPCVEGLFMSILNQDRDWTVQTVKDCKREFHSKYIIESNKTDPQKYQKYFTKEVIDAARKRLSEIDQLLKIMTEL